MRNVIRNFNHRAPRRTALAVAVLFLAAIATTGWCLQGSATADVGNRGSAAADVNKGFAAVTKEVEPAVVFIRAVTEHVKTSNMPDLKNFQGQLPDDLLRQFFGDRLPDLSGPRKSQPMIGEGSGFLISKDGYILTNNHVVGGADKLEVTLSDGRKWNAKVVGADERTDVAVIKIDAKDLPILALGDSDSLQVGDWVLAVGSPFGLRGTVTEGIVSAMGRDGMGITDYENFIQTDAAINPGNSGGPLVNLQGQAVGLNTAIATNSGTYNGVGFAIPINMAKQVADQLMQHGTVTRGYLGISIQELTPELAKTFGFTDATGVLIGDVSHDSPAAAAGLQRGDIVVSINSQPVKDVMALRNAVAMMKPGTSITLDIVRQGEHKTMTLNIGQLPETAAARSGGGHESVDSSWGLSVQTLNQQLAQQLGLDAAQGVVVTNVDPASVAAEAGIRSGMVITEVNRKPVKSAQEFEEAVKAAKDSHTLLLLVQANGHTQYVVLEQGNK